MGPTGPKKGKGKGTKQDKTKSRTKQNNRRLDKIRLAKPSQVKLSLVKQDKARQQDKTDGPPKRDKTRQETREDWTR
jgi:hypothetical protein